jgi:rhodanese-related sulfurtransferase
LLTWLLGPRVEPIEGPALAQLMKSPTPPYILDVRTPGEFKAGHIPGAHLIPLGEVRRRLEEIPKDQLVVTVCLSGHRSFSAAQTLAKAGYQVKNLHGGMRLWNGKVKR